MLTCLLQSVLRPDYQHGFAKGGDKGCSMDVSGAPTAIEQPQFCFIVKFG